MPEKKLVKLLVTVTEEEAKEILRDDEVVIRIGWNTFIVPDDIVLAEVSGIISGD